MVFRLTAILSLGFAGMVLAGDYLPLPKQAPTPPPIAAPEGLLKPSVTLDLGDAGDGDGRTAREQAILEIEKKLAAEKALRAVAAEAKKGNPRALKQLIVMLGPVDDALAKSPKPPVSGKGQVALIGLADGQVASKNLEQFFGPALTPEMEQQLLENVKSQIVGKDRPDVEVKIAGWWPSEGVMAVSVVPKG